MKKLLCLLLALMMLLALMAGCDSDRRRDDDDEDDDDGRSSHSSGDRKPGKKDDDDDDVVIVDDDDDVVVDDDDEKDVPASDATEPPTEPPTESVEEASNLSLGYWEGNTYINEYTGFVCDLDASWTIYSAQDLQDLPEQVANAGSEELGDFLKNYTQLYAMMAENTTDLLSINLLYQKMTPEQMVYYGSLNKEELIDTTLAEVAMLEEQYSSLGITVYSHEKVKVTFMGEEHYALYSVMELQGIPYYTLQLVDYSLGEYGMTLTLASYVEDKTQSMLELFKPLN